MEDQAADAKSDIVKRARKEISRGLLEILEGAAVTNIKFTRLVNYVLALCINCAAEARLDERAKHGQR